MKKTFLYSIMSLIIVLAVFSIIVFIAPFEKNGVFWLSYAFAIVGIAFQALTVYGGFVKGGTLKSKLYGFPIARVGFIYMVAQLILSALFIVIAPYVDITIPVIIFAIVLGVALLGLIATNAMREEIERQDAYLKKDVTLMRALQSKTRTMVSVCGDEECKKQLKAFSEELQYSDPVSSDSIAHMEGELAALVEEVNQAVLDGDYASAQALCRKASGCLAERNRLCKLNK